MQTKSDVLRDKKVLPAGFKMTPKQINKRIDRVVVWLERFPQNGDHNENKLYVAFKKELTNLLKRVDRTPMKKAA